MEAKQKKKLMWQVPFLLLLVVGTVLIIRQQQSEPYQHCKGFIFGTVYNVTYQSKTDLQAEIEQELAELSGTQKSNISRLESGTYNPTLDFLSKVASSMGRKVSINITPANK